jgi:NADH-quinone oxidoreductase subunit I
MAYFQNIYDAITTTLQGMSITFRQLFRPAVTIQYPTVKESRVKGYRGQLFNEIDDCTGCSMCVKACPVDCIVLSNERARPEQIRKTTRGTKRVLLPMVYDIDMAKCMYCEFCVRACPEDCLTMGDTTEYAGEQRDELYFRFGLELRPEDKKVPSEKASQ